MREAASMGVAVTAINPTFASQPRVRYNGVIFSCAMYLVASPADMAPALMICFSKLVVSASSSNTADKGVAMSDR